MSRSLLGIAMRCVLLLVLLLWLLLLLAFAPFALLFLLALASPCILLLSLACKSFRSSNDGKSWYSEGSCIWIIYLNRGGSLREGRVPGSPRPEAGGFPKWVHVGTFFAFFSNVFLTSIFLRFFFDFGGVLEAKMASKIDFWRGFWDAFWAPSF